MSTSGFRMDCKKESYLGFRSLTKKQSKRFIALREEQELSNLKENYDFVEPKPLKKPSFRKRRQSFVCDDNISVLSLDAGILKGEHQKKRRLSRMSSFSALLSPAKQIKKVGGMLTRARSTMHLMGSSSSGEHPLDAHPGSPASASGAGGSQSQLEPSSPSPLVRSPSFDNITHSRKSKMSSAASQSDSEVSQAGDGDGGPPSAPLTASGGAAGSIGSFGSRPGSLRKKPRPTGSIKRGRQWIEKFKEEKRAQVLAQISYWELKRQEVLYELYKGEKYLVQDLEMLERAYRSGLECLKILKPEEVQMVFGPIRDLVPVHKCLQHKLKEERDIPTKTIQKVGKILWDWVVELESVYVPYCCSQTGSKDLLDSRKAKCSQMRDFLNRCQESDFSRRLDLWNFLDVPRSKLMKYPLLLKSILKQTPEGHEDRDYLPQVIEKVEEVIRAVDQKTGESNCQYVLKKIEFTDEKQREPFLSKAKTILCQGELKNNRGTKLYGFLFDTGFLLTRPVEREDGATCYRAHKQPVSAHSVVFADFKDSEGNSRSGSFKSTFSYSNASTNRNVFQVSSLDEREIFILSASNEHDKLEWLQRLRDVKAHNSGLITTHSSPALRRASEQEILDPSSPPSTPHLSSAEDSEGSSGVTHLKSTATKSILKSKNWSFGGGHHGGKTPLRRTSLGKLGRRKSVESSFGSDENICPSATGVVAAAGDGVVATEVTDDETHTEV